MCDGIYQCCGSGFTTFESGNGSGLLDARDPNLDTGLVKNCKKTVSVNVGKNCIYLLTLESNIQIFLDPA
jgi:hypothetical protein